MRDGENALEVIERVKSKLSDLQRSLPDGVEIVTVYDRAPLIEGAVSYLEDKLIEEGLVVALVIFIFLLHFRAAFRRRHHLAAGCLRRIHHHVRPRRDRQYHVTGRHCDCHWGHGGCLHCHGGKWGQKTLGY